MKLLARSSARPDDELRIQYRDSDLYSSFWSLLFPRAFLGLALTVLAIILCNVLLGWVATGIWSDDHGHLLVLAIIVVGVVIGAIAADLERAYREAHRHD
jgi:hypothetical protein